MAAEFVLCGWRRQTFLNRRWPAFAMLRPPSEQEPAMMERENHRGSRQISATSGTSLLRFVCTGKVTNPGEPSNRRPEFNSNDPL